MLAWHAAAPFLVMSCCALGSPFLLSRNSVNRSFAATSHQQFCQALYLARRDRRGLPPSQAAS